MTWVSIERGIASGFLFHVADDLIRVEPAKGGISAVDWAAAIADVVERYYGSHGHNGRRSLEGVAKDAIARCRLDPASHDYIRVLLWTMRDREGDADVAVLREFASIKPRNIRCKCGARFTWADRYQRHVAECAQR